MCENPITIYNKEKGWIKVKCGKCIICRKNKCRDWAIKLINEGKYHKKMCMVTLTFRLKFLLKPYIKEITKIKQKRQANGEIKKWKYKIIEQVTPEYIHNVKRTGWLITLFIKKLRKKLMKEGKFISYFAVGEHGTENTHRAHWHILFFGLGIDDLRCRSIGKSKKNKEIYFSETIDELWSHKKTKIGKHTISEVTDATIKYVANYTMKKMYKDTSVLPVTMRFSNQNKITAKWVRYNHYELRKGYLIDNDGAKYKIPEGYLAELRRYENDIYNTSKNETLAIIETIKDNYIKKRNEKLDTIEEGRKKAHREEIRQKLIERTF